MFLELEFADLVAQLDNLERLDESRLAAGRFVVDDAGQFLFHAGRHGDEHATVADHDFGIAFDQAFSLGCAENGIDAAGDLPLFRAEGAADFAKFRRSGVTDFPGPVEDGLDAAADFRLIVHRGRNLPEGGIEVILAFAEESQDPAERVEAGAEHPQRREVDGRVLRLQRQEECLGIEIAAGRKTVFKQADEPHFIGEAQAEHDFGRIAGNLLRGDLPDGILRSAFGGNLFPNQVEADLLFQYHAPSLPCY